MIATNSLNFGNAPFASPSVTTQASATAANVVNVSVMSDAATITGGLNLTGTLTFTLTAPDGTTTTLGTVAVNGAGTYAAPRTVPATEVGTYTFHAIYSGDANNTAATDNGANESITIVQGGVSGFVIPILTTQITSSNGVAVGTGMLGDTATLIGGLNPTGTITFTLIAPDGSTAATETVQVNGNGVYRAPTLVPVTQVGTYTWHAVYSGDVNDAAVADNGVNESAETFPAASKRALLASFLRSHGIIRVTTPAAKPAPPKKSLPVARLATPTAAQRVSLAAFIARFH
jgi:hypothetical protein